MQMLLVNLMAAASLAVTATGDLDWSTHYGNAKRKAEQTNRPLLVVLENPAVAADRLDDTALNGSKERMKSYQLCRVDVTTAYGKRVAAAFGVKELPYTAVTDHSARFITFRRAGKMSSVEWTQALGNSARVITASQRNVQTSNRVYCPT